MKQADKQATIFRDMAVFEYVAGTQSDSAKKDFEQQLSIDQELVEELKFERLLRIMGNDNDDEYSVNMSNFDQLVDNIENNKLPTAQNVQQFPYKRLTGIAASIVTAAIAISVFTGDMLQPKFETLFSESQTTYTDFSELAAQQRLARIVVTNSTKLEEIKHLLNEYKLESISSNIEQNMLLVTSPNAIDNAMLTKLRSDKRTQDVILVQYQTEK